MSNPEKVPIYPALKLIEALDLLDQLVDTLQHQEHVLATDGSLLRSRVIAWKAMLREQVEQVVLDKAFADDAPPSSNNPPPQSIPTGLPPYGGG